MCVSGRCSILIWAWLIQHVYIVILCHLWETVITKNTHMRHVVYENYGLIKLLFNSRKYYRFLKTLILEEKKWFLFLGKQNEGAKHNIFLNKIFIQQCQHTVVCYLPSIFLFLSVKAKREWMAERDVLYIIGFFSSNLNLLAVLFIICIPHI